MTQDDNIIHSSTMMKLIHSLKQNIKAFNGDIYGNVLTINESELSALNNKPPLVVNCRVDMYLFSVFIQVLNIHFDVQSFPFQFSGIDEPLGLSKQYIINLKNNKDAKVILDVCFQSVLEWVKAPCDFDINLLAENSSSVFLRTNYNCLDRFVDKYGYIKHRIDQRAFTVLDVTVCRTTEKLKNLIDKSQALVQRGWIMDDILYGAEVWNVNLWLTYQMRPQKCRMFHDKKKLDMLTSLNECPLCNEPFDNCDIVINTKCNHNFHWCNPRCRGLCEWLKRGNMTCPVCRKNAL